MSYFDTHDTEGIVTLIKKEGILTFIKEEGIVTFQETCRRAILNGKIFEVTCLYSLSITFKLRFEAGPK
jgi:hypothetical protein